jgi:broad specificity phosphatase PhoE
VGLTAGLLLLRHARAGHRSEWVGDDRDRPLDKRGRRQAAALVDQLAPVGLERILTSPYRRCVETVIPLAEATGLRVEERDELAEGTGDATARLARKVAGSRAVLCTHGDVIAALIGERRAQKGSIWVLSPELEPLEYLPPPS